MAKCLPIEASARAILDALRDHQVIVVAGPTGCGKTSILPQILHEAGYSHEGNIAITEPRRVAAMSVATWVAKCRGVDLGTEVGYMIRHEKFVSEETRILYGTEGVFLREMLADPDLRRYSVIVIDEAHERGYNQDVILALVKRLCRRRPDLKVVIMSATIAEQDFADYFAKSNKPEDQVPIIRIQGRQYPVEIRYLDNEPNDPIEAAINWTPRMMQDIDHGDTLVFIPDYASIRRLLEDLPRVLPKGTEIVTLYGDQSPDEQRAVVFGRDPAKRYVILATNVAETSVTLDGVTVVIDTGLIKLKAYEPGQAISTLKPRRHSKAGMEQRAGRAGRTAPGVCLRLMTEAEYDKRREYTKPEILRIDLADVLLHMLALGFGFEEITEFGWLTPPSFDLWQDARRKLKELGALNKHGELTDVGWFMSDLPLPPALSKMILEAQRRRCVTSVLIIAASFSARPVFLRPPGEEDAADEAQRCFLNKFSDFMTTLNVYRAWERLAREERSAFCKAHFLNPKALMEIQSVAKQLGAILVEKDIELSDIRDSVKIGKSIASGLIENLLLQNSENGRAYMARHRSGVFLFPGSALCKLENRPAFAVCSEIVETKLVYARQVQEIPQNWLKDLGLDAKVIRTACGRTEKGKKKGHPEKRKGAGKGFRHDRSRGRHG